MNKPWERDRDYGRRVETRFVRDKILIVCEGKKTEPNYFLKFPVKTELVEMDVTGTGANTLSLVRKTIQRSDEARRQGKPYNQVWCVFDRDVFPAANFRFLDPRFLRRGSEMFPRACPSLGCSDLVSPTVACRL